ncbi:MAG: NAD-dependent epimerase/dehydratase family protein [Bacteroidia bacterium]
MKNYLVTGGAGFIGAAVARSLLDDGHRVVILDNLSTGHLENIPEGAEFIRGFCEDQELINTLRNEKFEAIYHIAGQSSGEISYDDPVLDMQANVQSTLVLLKFAVETGCTTFIYASSMSVYGNAEKLPVSEQTPTFPVSFYAVGKLASEHYLRIFQTYAIKTVALRLFNVYGEGQNLENLRQGMASIFLAQAIKSGNIIVKGSPERFRDFIHVSEVVQAFRKAEVASVPSGIYNVCRGEKVSVREVLDCINSNLPSEAGINFTEGTPGDQFGIYGNPELFESVFQLKSRMDFKTGMGNMVKWALNKLK